MVGREAVAAPGASPGRLNRRGLGSLIRRPRTPRPVGRGPIRSSSSGSSPTVMNSDSAVRSSFEHPERAVPGARSSTGPRRRCGGAGWEARDRPRAGGSPRALAGAWPDPRSSDRARMPPATPQLRGPAALSPCTRPSSALPSGDPQRCAARSGHRPGTEVGPAAPGQTGRTRRERHHADDHPRLPPRRPRDRPDRPPVAARGRGGHRGGGRGGDGRRGPGPHPPHPAATWPSSTSGCPTGAASRSAARSGRAHRRSPASCSPRTPTTRRSSPPSWPAPPATS